MPGFMSNFRFRVLTENEKYDIESTAVLTNTKYAAFERKTAQGTCYSGPLNKQYI